MREPYQIIEIDQKICSLVYGTAPCAAGLTGTNDRCYNTVRTCQDRANFTDSILTLKFTHSKDEIQKGFIPSLLSVSTTPTQINAGGVSRDRKALGSRGSVSISLQDHPHSDYFVDPYKDQRNYIATDRGTFWAKWLARNPYYKNTVIRVIDGYLGEAPRSTKSYVIDNIAGPDSRGKVTIKAKDILSLADDKQAQAPAVSLGELIADINGSITTLRVTGADAAEYPAPGHVRLGKEIISFAAVSTISATEINLTGCVRAAKGTEARDSDLGNQVQLCLEYTNQEIAAVVYDLLVNYGNISPSFIDFSQWQSENDIWLNQFNVSTIISKPTGVTNLLYEICEQTLTYIWYDERNQNIQFRAVRPATETPFVLNEENHILADSANLMRKENERFSQVWIFHQQRDPTEKLDKDTNWLRLRVAADGENPYEDAQIKKIYGRWIQSEAQARSLANRLLNRYKQTPIYMEISLDAKDGEIWTGDICDISHGDLVDFSGSPQETRFQVLSAEEVESGHKISYKLINFVYFGRFAFWMGASAADYDAATETEKVLGMYWAGADGLVNGDLGYEWN